MNYIEVAITNKEDLDVPAKHCWARVCGETKVTLALKYRTVIKYYSLAEITKMEMNRRKDDPDYKAQNLQNLMEY